MDARRRIKLLKKTFGILLFLASTALFMESQSHGRTLQFQERHWKGTEGQRHQCQPHRHVFYLKVPKTGSSTFNSILSRMVLKHNLTHCGNVCKHPHPNTLLKLLDLQPESNRTRYDMKLIHTKYNKNLFLRSMEEDTQYIATLRHPLSQFKSFLFYKRKHQSTVSDLEAAFKDMIESSKPDPSKNYFLAFEELQYFENAMFRYFEFNYTHALFNETYFKQCINDIGSYFRIIITEKYDEALLLLKRQLCWSIKDIIYIAHKISATPVEDNRTRETAVLETRHRNISKLDYDLYDHFLRLHNENVLAAGDDFRAELQEFQWMNSNTSQFCWSIYDQLMQNSAIKPQSVSLLLDRELTVESGRFWDSFVVSGQDCMVMALCENHLKHIRLALNYPISCDREFEGCDFKHSFCASSYVNGTDYFAHDNVYFPYSQINDILTCDLFVNFKREKTQT